MHICYGLKFFLRISGGYSISRRCLAILVGGSRSYHCSFEIVKSVAMICFRALLIITKIPRFDVVDHGFKTGVDAMAG